MPKMGISRKVHNALALRPREATELHRAGRLSDAERGYRQVLRGSRKQHIQSSAKGSLTRVQLSARGHPDALPVLRKLINSPKDEEGLSL